MVVSVITMIIVHQIALLIELVLVIVKTVVLTVLVMKDVLVIMTK